MGCIFYVGDILKCLIYALNLNGNTITKTLGDGTVASHVYNLDEQVTDLNETLSGTSFAKFIKTLPTWTQGAGNFLG